MEMKSFPVLQVIDQKAMYMTPIHKNAKHLFQENNVRAARILQNVILILCKS